MDEKELKFTLDSHFAVIKEILEQGRKIKADPTQLFLFKGMYVDLKDSFTAFRNTWAKLVEVAKEGFPSEKEKNFEITAKRYYYEANAIYQHYMNPTPTTAVSAPSTSTASYANTGFLNESRSLRSHLPEIKLPKFDGQFSNWITFRDTYLSLIHSPDSNLADMEKYHYLLSSVSGSAKTLLKSIPFDEEHYDQAWKTLMENFNNKRLLASNYLRPVIDAKPAVGKPTIKSLTDFLVNISENVTAFKMLKIPDAEEFILFSLAIRLLDPVTRVEFEKEYIEVEFPKFSDLVEFVKRQRRSLELSLDCPANIQSNVQNFQIPNKKFNKFQNPQKSAFLAEKSNNGPTRNNSNPQFSNSQARFTKKRPPCVVCTLSHSLYGCSKFRDASPSARVTMLQNFKGCENCLSYDHVVQKCPSLKDCDKCHAKHHSWLHLENDEKRSNSLSTSTSSRSPASSTGVYFSGAAEEGEVLLGTAIAFVQDARGQYQPVRMVLDSGSQLSFITSKCVQRLGLKLTVCTKNISGIGQTILHGLKGQVSCKIRPSNGRGVSLTTDAITVTSITNELPHSTVPSAFVRRCESFSLADPYFWKPGPVDFLLGADLYYDIISGTPIIIEPNQPKLTPTIFGHVVAGKSRGSEENSFSTLLAIGDNLSTAIQRFWQVEEVKVKPLMSQEDRDCEQHFRDTHFRLPSGRYVVRLPLKTPDVDLGSSRKQALTRFLNLESKLHRNPGLQREYNQFMKEYLNLGHMQIASEPAKYIIPHHPVIKMENGSMKIRVVFDASSITPQGSLNDHLMVGPKLQLDIADILLNFRQYRVVFTADIVKMFRQTEVAPVDRVYQHVFWRFDPKDPIEEYELCTITYGLASSPYQSLRVLHQLREDEGSAYPLASKVLTEETYVDDILTGANSVEEALQLKQELIDLLEKGCFKLSKWLTNRTELLETSLSFDEPPHNLDSMLDNTVKILGMQYCPKEDIFCYCIDTPPSTMTKRAILSAISRIYDPLGYLAPVVFLAKTILQETWLSKCDWDHQIPNKIMEAWQRFIGELHLLSQVRIPRFIPAHHAEDVQVLGFCDASTKGYAAAIFLRVTMNGATSIFLIKAKTKLAPTKTLTVPRLELNGALLLAGLYTSVDPFLKKFSISQFHSFTDSTVILGWLRMSPSLLKIYVAHRVVEINHIIDPSTWRHIRSEDNPVDCASRGLHPSSLAKHDLWWSGPQWLQLHPNEWPVLANTSHYKPAPGDPEVKQVDQTLLVQDFSPTQQLLEYFSSYFRLLRSVAIFRRYTIWLKSKELDKKPISVIELHQAQLAIVRLVQAQHFHLDKSLDHLKSTKARNLDPFMDKHGVVRVGGRLCHSMLPYHQKHPILLPGKSHFTRLLINHYHEAYLHLGPALLQNLIRNQFWILSARSTIKQQVHKCLKCFKSNPKPENPKMGDLPASRFLEGRPFINVGVDYGGPFIIRASLRRNAAQSKAYLCLFVCFSTKALHLELVSSGTTEAFLAALDRFTARRGKPSHIYSDNGRNFVGAARELKEVIAWLKEDQPQQKIHQHLALQGIEWSFNPPQSPHFGGIWEAGIKAVKGILKKVVSETPFTFEELSTIFARAEAILNSRPLCPLYDDPDSLDVLTPGHFIIGSSMISNPEHDLLDCRENVLSRWQLVKQRIQRCWQRWRNEYLATLQQRVKWTKPARNLAQGDLVLLRDVNTPPIQWPLARILLVHPGIDGMVRVITVKTATGVYKRSAANVIPLYPILESSNP